MTLTEQETHKITNMESCKVVLCPVSILDFDKALEWRNDPDIRDYVLGHPLPVTTKMEERWFDQILEGKAHDRVVFAIKEKQDNRLIGFAYLNDIDWIAQTSQMGIVLGDKTRHGRGFGKESVRLLLGFAFHQINLRRLWLRIVEYNIPAIRLYKSFGFAQEGILRQHVFRQGKLHDVLIMGTFKSDFISLDFAK